MRTVKKIVARLSVLCMLGALACMTACVTTGSTTDELVDTRDVVQYSSAENTVDTRDVVQPASAEKVTVSWEVPDASQGTVRVRIENLDDLKDLAQGAKVSVGSKLWFTFDYAYGYVPDIEKIRLNGKTLKEIGVELDEEYGFSYEAQSKEAINLTAAFRKAEKLNFSCTLGAGGDTFYINDVYPEKTPETDISKDDKDKIKGFTTKTFQLYEGTRFRVNPLPQKSKILKKWTLDGADKGFSRQYHMVIPQKKDAPVGGVKLAAEFGASKKITVTWSSKNTTQGDVSGVKYNQDAKKWLDVTNGKQWPEGERLAGDARPKLGYSVDKWYMNNEPIPDAEDGEGYTFDVLESIAKDDVIDIQASFRKAEKIKVVWSSVNTDCGTLRDAGVRVDGDWKNFPSGSEFYEGQCLNIHADTKQGWMVDCWKINGKAVENSEVPNYLYYYVDKNDKDSSGIIKIEAYFKRAEPIQLRWSSTSKGSLTARAEINGEWQDVSETTKLYEEMEVRIDARPPYGYKFKKWLLNGAEHNFGGEPTENGAYVLYTLKKGDSDSDGKITIQAVFEVNSKEPQGKIPVTFKVKAGSEANGSLIARLQDSWRQFPSGTKFNANTELRFEAKPNEGYACSWYVNGKERSGNHNRALFYRLSDSDKTAGGLSVELAFIKVDKVTVNFEVEGKGTIEIKANNTPLTLGSHQLDEYSRIWIKAIPAENSVADWFVNGEDANNKRNGDGDFLYDVTKEAVQSGVITIKAKFRKAQ